MFNTLSIAASGMRAADLRLQAAARNIANANSFGSVPNAVGAQQTKQAYRLIEVIQSSVEGGGVRAGLHEKSEPYVETYSPSSVYSDARGMVAAPNVDLAKEMTDVVDAEMTFTANVMVVNVVNRMFDALIDALDPNRDDRRRWRTTL
jgi:flagellar basal-body rod protein FlgC